MTIKNFYLSDKLVGETLTIDGKLFSKLTEDELNNIRLRLADLLRKQPVSRDNLAYIIQTIASSYGVWDYERKTIQLSL
jgi:hypothetical protein